MSQFLATLVFGLVLALTLCAGAKTPTPAAKARAAVGKTPLDACSLLTGQEIEAVQGAAPKATKRSEKSEEGLIISQCYFLLPTAADSIVVTLTQRGDGPKARDPKESWREIFHRDHESAKESEEEEEQAKPEAISGLGDEAFWTVARVGGALYALKGNCYIRISLGGAGDQASKLKKSKSLAEAILKSL